MTTYSFRTSWWVPHEVDAVASVLIDLARYPEWWKQVVAVVSLGPDDARVLCRSRLPYTLDLTLHAVTRVPPVLETRIGGDLAGIARWRLVPRGAGTLMDYEQDVDVTAGGLRALSSVAGPLLRWNHRQMMAGCRAGLLRRLGDGSGPATPRAR